MKKFCSFYKPRCFIHLILLIIYRTINDIIRKSEYKIKSEDVDFCFNLMQKFYKKPKEGNSHLNEY